MAEDEGEASKRDHIDSYTTHPQLRELWPPKARINSCRGRSGGRDPGRESDDN